MENKSEDYITQNAMYGGIFMHTLYLMLTFAQILHCAPSLSEQSGADGFPQKEEPGCVQNQRPLFNEM